MLDRLKSFAVRLRSGAQRHGRGEDGARPFSQPRDASRQVRKRRLKRRLKAGASILVALAAGAFIACMRKAGKTSHPPPARADGGVGATVAADAGGTGAADHDAGIDASVSRDARVDVHEHRKGMPVPDTLIE